LPVNRRIDGSGGVVGAVFKRAHVSPPAQRGIGRFFPLLRAHQWVKNLFVFAALIFGQALAVPGALARTVAAFTVFCALASATYVLNDIIDVERDRIHPVKRNRPLPSGAVTSREAGILGAGLGALGVVGAAALGGDFLACAAVYVGLQIAYSTWLKDIVIVDVMTVALGFVIRAFAGGVVIDVPVSPWLVICTFLLALLLAVAKRRHEALLLVDAGPEHRKSLGQYSERFIDQMIAVVTGATVIAYALYTVSPEVQEKLGTHYLYVTFPFPLFGIFRYLYLVYHRTGGGDPAALLLQDKPLLANVVLWLFVVLLLLY
jgi:4-hydroxybenzoate polyprenyltransferase